MSAWRHFLKEWGLIVGLVVVLGGAFLLLRTPAGPVERWDDLAPYYGQGEPVVVELYSNLCSRCLLNKPVVDDLERDLAGMAPLFRVERGTAVAVDLARRHQVQLLPALLIFDGQGNLVELQQGDVDRAAALAVVEGLHAQPLVPLCPVTPEAHLAAPTCDGP